MISKEKGSIHTMPEYKDSVYSTWQLGYITLVVKGVQIFL